MSPQDMSIKIHDGTFNYRVGAIIKHSGKILMVKNTESSFFYTVGGRPKFGETMRDAVIREAFEETQIVFEIDRLAFIHENFFVMENNDEPYHEITFFYVMMPNDSVSEMKTTSFTEEYAEVTLHWFPIDGLCNLHIYPEFFKTELCRLSDGIKHFITKNGTTFQAM